MTAALACVLQPTCCFVSVGARAAFQQMSIHSRTIDTTPWSIVNGKGLASERRRSPGMVHAGGTSSLQIQPTVSEAEAKRELLDLVSQPATTEVKERVTYLVEALQASFVPIQTVEFFNIAAQVRGSCAEELLLLLNWVCVWAASTFCVILEQYGRNRNILEAPCCDLGTVLLWKHESAF